MERDPRSDESSGRSRPPTAQSMQILATGRLAALVAFGLFNAWWLWVALRWVPAGLNENDWYWFATLDPATAYATWFKWAPPMAYVIHWVATTVPFWLWAGFHFAALATLPRRVVAFA